VWGRLAGVPLGSGGLATRRERRLTIGAQLDKLPHKICAARKEISLDVNIIRLRLVHPRRSSDGFPSAFSATSAGRVKTH